ncbi:MAG: hypothetical protein H7145_08675 [Akkermansiaceae bacterium]|nr:hypothetical protein [Armatimonadota bacterium]
MRKILEPSPRVWKGVPPTILFDRTGDTSLSAGRKFLAKSVATGNNADCLTAAKQPHEFLNGEPTIQTGTVVLSQVGLAPSATQRVPDKKEENKLQEPTLVDMVIR